MKQLLILILAIATSLTARAAVPADQGGAGSIDPNSVSFRELLRYSLGADTEIHTAVGLVTDSAANKILGSVLQRPGSANGAPQYNPPRSVITKFNSAGATLWARERKVNCVTDRAGTTCYERFSDDQTPVAIEFYEGSCTVRLVALALDAQNNVFAGFDVIYASTNGGVSDIRDTNINLIVKFDSNGKFIWRRSTASVSDPDLVDASRLLKLDVGSDGSVVALINNFQSNNQNLHQVVLVKYAADGTKVTFNRYGMGPNRTFDYDSQPITFVQDSSRNIFLITVEAPNPTTNYTPDKVFNVIRKLDPNGNLVTRKDVRLYPTYTAGGTNYALDSWEKAQMDSAGNLYVAGTHFRNRLSSSEQGEANQLVLKFATDLTQLWRVLGPQAQGKYPGQPGVAVSDLALSANGITVAGNTTNIGTAVGDNDDHWEVNRYAADDGHLIWHRRYQQQGDPSQGSTDTLTAMRVDADGNVYASGGVSMSTGGSRQALIKYSDGGDLQFVKLIPDAYLGIQPVNLSLPASTNRPTLFGRDQFDSKQAFAIDLDNPAVVAAVGSLANISTRVRVGGNDNVLIGGFIVTGASGTTKKVLIRAVGPSLTQFGVSGALPDTKLEVHDSTGKVYTNDNWKTADPGQPSQQSEIQASGVAPLNDLESAIIATVPPGNTTAIVSGKGGATGIGLVEVYDLDAASAARIANISTRGRVETGDNVMIGGVIVLAPNPARVVVRAIAPSLAAFGVANVLQDPKLELRDVNGNLIVSNDDWKTRDGSGVSQQSEIEATAVPPTDSRESALRATLDPGNYTAIIRGKKDASGNETTGVALVEVYRLP